MARDFSTMKANVGKYIQDTSSTFSALISTWINDKYRDISKRAAWSALVDNNYTFNTVANTAEYSLPTDFDEEIYVTNITDGTPLKRYNEGNWWDERSTAYSNSVITGGGLPKRYIILRESNKILLDPTPDAVKTIAFPYKKLVTELSGDTDAPAIHDIEMILEFGALGEALAYKKQYQTADYYFQRYEDELSKRIKRERSPVNALNQRIPANYRMSTPTRFTGDTPYA